jgi:hypothetical protein
MATTPLKHDSPASRPRAHRRWLWIGGLAGAFLLVYALGLGWAAQRLQTDVQDSIHPLTLAQPDQH